MWSIHLAILIRKPLRMHGGSIVAFGDGDMHSKMLDDYISKYVKCMRCVLAIMICSNVCMCTHGKIMDILINEWHFIRKSILCLLDREAQHTWSNWNYFRDENQLNTLIAMFWQNHDDADEYLSITHSTVSNCPEQRPLFQNSTRTYFVKHHKDSQLQNRKHRCKLSLIKCVNLAQTRPILTGPIYFRTDISHEDHRTHDTGHCDPVDTFYTHVQNENIAKMYEFVLIVILMINSSSPSAAYMRQWIGSALVQMTACHYLNQYKFIINWPLETNFSGIRVEIQSFYFTQNTFENVVSEMAAIF